jgi:hypothetical protein
MERTQLLATTSVSYHCGRPSTPYTIIPTVICTHIVQRSPPTQYPTIVEDPQHRAPSFQLSFANILSSVHHQLSILPLWKTLNTVHHHYNCHLHTYFPASTTTSVSYHCGRSTAYQRPPLHGTNSHSSIPPAYQSRKRWPTSAIPTTSQSRKPLHATNSHSAIPPSHSAIPTAYQSRKRWPPTYHCWNSLLATSWVEDEGRRVEASGGTLHCVDAGPSSMYRMKSYILNRVIF